MYACMHKKFQDFFFFAFIASDSMDKKSSFPQNNLEPFKKLTYNANCAILNCSDEPLFCMNFLEKIFF